MAALIRNVFETEDFRPRYLSIADAARYCGLSTQKEVRLFICAILPLLEIREPIPGIHSVGLESLDNYLDRCPRNRVKT